MIPFARLIRVSAAAAVIALAGVSFTGCSEASRMETRCLTGDVAVCIQPHSRHRNGRRHGGHAGRARAAAEPGVSRECRGA